MANKYDLYVYLRLQGLMTLQPVAPFLKWNGDIGGQNCLCLGRQERLGQSL